MKRFWPSLLLFIFINVFYLLMFPLTIDRQPIYEIDNFFSFDSPVVDQSSDGYIVTDTLAVHFSTESGITQFTQAPPDFSISAGNDGFILYGKKQSSQVFYNTRGVQVAENKQRAYPFIDNSMPVVYMVKTNGSGYTPWSMQGEQLYNTVTFTSVITAISSDLVSNTLVSTLAGKTKLLDREGTSLFEHRIEKKSRINLTKANAINDNGSIFAIMSGIDPEYIEIFETKSKTRIHVVETATDFRYQPYLHVTDDELYYESNGSITSYNLRTGKQRAYRVPGELIDVAHASDGMLCVTSLDDRFYTLTLYHKNGIRAWQSQFSSSVDNCRFLKNGYFYFRLDKKVITMSRSSMS
jgi:hypothetical protein